MSPMPASMLDLLFLRGYGPSSIRQVVHHQQRTAVCNLTVIGLKNFCVGEVNALVHNVSNSHEEDKTVGEILKGKKGSIKDAPLPQGSPSWGEILNMTWREIEAAAKRRIPGFKTIRKLLTDKRFDK